MERNLKNKQNENWTRGKIKLQNGKAFFVLAEPDPIDTIERSRSARLRAVEEFDGVGVEREALEVLDKVVGEDLVEVEDVDRDVHDRADDDQAGKEGDHSHHAPITSFNIDLTKRGSGPISFSSLASSSAVWQFVATKSYGERSRGKGRRFSSISCSMKFNIPWGWGKV